MEVERRLHVGDIIVCKGSKITIGKVLSQDAFSGHSGHPGLSTREQGYYDIEFEDKKGKYRHWKSYEDGGYVNLYPDYRSLEMYSKAMDNILTCITSIRNLVKSKNSSTDVKRVIIKSLKTGNTRLRVEFIGMKAQETEVDDAYDVIPTRWGTLTPIMASLSLFLRKDISNLVWLNSNIDSIEFRCEEGSKYFTGIKIEDSNLVNSPGKKIILF